MSEGPFYLAVATWAWLLLAAKSPPIVRASAIGAIGGLAFLLRPEGGALVLVGALAAIARGERLEATTTAVVGAAIMALLPLGFWWFGDGATLTPKAAFNYEVGVGSASSPVWQYLSEAAELPLAFGEALGLWSLFAVVGFVRWRARSRREPAAWLLWPFWMQCAVVPLLQSHWRFLSGFGILLLPFAGAAAVELFSWLRCNRPRVAWVLPALLAAAEVRAFVPRNEHSVERDLGRALAATLAPGEFVISDMPRLDYFAGQKPPPPRPILPAEVLARAADPHCRHVALVTKRTAVSDAELMALGLEPAEPPPILTAAVLQRGIRLFQRPRPR